MISINLIPDVKLEMLRAQKMRTAAISISIIVGIIAAAVVAILAGILGAQVALISAKNGEITKSYSKLSSTEGINDTLTIQNQSSKITDINNNKTRDSRLLDVLAAINPAAPNDMKFSKVTLDPAVSTLTIEGSAAGGFAATEVFRKTLLNTSVEGKERGSDELISIPLTADVLLQNMSYGEDANGTKVLQFTVVFTYPEKLFNNAMSEVVVKTPTNKIDVTDSKTRVPDSLLNAPVKNVEEDK